jgi:hypothetical protein
MDTALLAHKWVYCLVTACYLKECEKLAGDMPEFKDEVAKGQKAQAAHEAVVEQVKKRITQSKSKRPS